MLHERGWPVLHVAQILHLAPVPLFRHFALVLLALQMLPELDFFTSADITHRTVELATGSHAHGEISRDPLPRAGIEVRTCGSEIIRGWETAEGSEFSSPAPTEKPGTVQICLHLRGTWEHAGYLNCSGLCTYSSWWPPS